MNLLFEKVTPEQFDTMRSFLTSGCCFAYYNQLERKVIIDNNK